MENVFKITLVFLLFVCVNTAFSQDTIYFKNGKTETGIIETINDSVLVYKKSSNPDGPLYSTSIINILKINYANGDTWYSTELKNELIYNEKMLQKKFIISYNLFETIRGKASTSLHYVFPGRKNIIKATYLYKFTPTFDIANDHSFLKRFHTLQLSHLRYLQSFDQNSTFIGYSVINGIASRTYNLYDPITNIRTLQVDHNIYFAGIGITLGYSAIIDPRLSICVSLTPHIIFVKGEKIYGDFYPELGLGIRL